MTLNLTADEVLTSTRSVRKRLDFEKPVPREVIMECLDLALQAPTGSNNQGWQFVFVEDEAKKKALADIYPVKETVRDLALSPEGERIYLARTTETGADVAVVDIITGAVSNTAYQK